MIKIIKILKYISKFIILIFFKIVKNKTHKKEKHIYNHPITDIKRIYFFTF